MAKMQMRLSAGITINTLNRRSPSAAPATRPPINNKPIVAIIVTTAWLAANEAPSFDQLIGARQHPQIGVKPNHCPTFIRTKVRMRRLLHELFDELKMLEKRITVGHAGA